VTTATTYATYPSLRDRVVFVTGGGSGIGASIVEHFVEQGARVAFVDIDRKASEVCARASTTVPTISRFTSIAMCVTSTRCALRSHARVKRWAMRRYW
jgi:NAD(P)-dependent dehydrogenase (short-subunit alcohol dehydrogenase family)